MTSANLQLILSSDFCWNFWETLTNRNTIENAIEWKEAQTPDKDNVFLIFFLSYCVLANTHLKGSKEKDKNFPHNLVEY